MSIEHILFDKERNCVPISATQIRGDFYNNWEYLPDAVKSFYQKKIVFLGTESTEKSSISKAISERYNSTLVEEVGREIVTLSHCKITCTKYRRSLQRIKAIRFY